MNVDVLLWAVVTKREWAIFTTDPDFTNYAKVLPLRIHAPRSAPALNPAFTKTIEML